MHGVGIMQIFQMSRQMVYIATTVLQIVNVLRKQTTEVPKKMDYTDVTFGFCV